MTDFLDQSQKKILEWVKLLREKKIRPILGTVVPVTKAHDAKKPGRFNSILEFNEFIRSTAKKEGIPLLDLEKALRISDDDRHLREDFAQPDGLHLIEKAYIHLDNFMASFLKNYAPAQEKE